jgi:hypothetical protein
MTQGANYTVIQTNIDPRIQQAINVIYSTHGHTVSVESKKKNLSRYGRNPAATTTASTVWSYGATQANEVLPTSNAIDTISSSSTSDTGSVKIEGHTISGSDLTFVVQTATLNGRNKVVLGTPLARAAFLYNNGSSDFVGDIYCYEESAITNGVPNTAAKVHLKASVAQADNESDKCAASISSVDYWILTGMDVAVLKKTAAYAEFSLQVKESGKVFRTVETISASNSSGTMFLRFDPFVIVPPNSDIRVTCIADASNTDVTADLYGVLATIV